MPGLGGFVSMAVCGVLAATEAKARSGASLDGVQSSAPVARRLRQDCSGSTGVLVGASQFKLRFRGCCLEIEKFSAKDAPRLACQQYIRRHSSDIQAAFRI